MNQIFIVNSRIYMESSSISLRLHMVIFQLRYPKIVSESLRMSVSYFIYQLNNCKFILFFFFSNHGQPLCFALPCFQFTTQIPLFSEYTWLHHVLLLPFSHTLIDVIFYQISSYSLLQLPLLSLQSPYHLLVWNHYYPL